MTDPTINRPATPPGVIPEVDYVALQPGQMIGRYEIVSVLGQGGFGITYRARDVQLGREVAIKEYLPSALAMRQDGTTVLPRSTKMADDFGWGRERFVDEGRTLASLHRVPAIVQVFDFLEANGTAYIVMELLQRRDARGAHQARTASSSPEEVDRILWPLLDGLEQVHNAGFLHRDIKPANILLDAAGNPTLIDFGASRAAMAGRSTAMTAIFTPGYAAAEQMTSAKQGPWTDIYGLSATLYHAITGKTPPSAFDRMLNDAYEPLAQLEPAGLLAGRAGRHRCRPRRGGPRPAADHRRLAADPRHDRGAGGAMPRSSWARRRRPPAAVRHVSTLPPPRRRGGAQAGPACGSPLAVVLLALLGGGGYYAIASRGPDPEMVKARPAAEEAEARRLKAEEEAAKLRAENEQRQKAEEAAGSPRTSARRTAEAAAKKQFEDETRRKIEAEMAAQKTRRRGGQAQGRRGGRGPPQGGRGCAQGRRVRGRHLRPFRQDADDDRPEGPAGRDPPAGRRHRQRSRRCTRSRSTRWPPSRATCAAGRPTA